MTKYYDERKYLKEDPEVIQKIEEKKEILQILYTNERDQYQEAIKNYQEFINVVAEFLQKFDCHSSIEYSILISYLIRNGYLSKNNKFNGIETNKEFVSCLGATILTGNGCCRNVATLHRDLLQKCGFPAKRFCCYLKLFPIPYHLRPANHMMTLIEYKGTRYAMDLYCGDRIYRFRSPFHLNEISSCRSNEAFYKPYYEIILGESTLDDIKKNLKNLEKESEKRWILPMEYEDEIYNNTFQYLRENEKKMQEIHHKTKSLRKAILKDLNRIHS